MDKKTRKLHTCALDSMNPIKACACFVVFMTLALKDNHGQLRCGSFDSISISLNATMNFFRSSIEVEAIASVKESTKFQ
jgi:hypothetical protein